jgi:hypothetical protein
MDHVTISPLERQSRRPRRFLGAVRLGRSFDRRNREAATAALDWHSSPAWMGAGLPGPGQPAYTGPNGQGGQG